MQFFKGDDQEVKMDAAVEPTLTAISDQLDDFFDGAFECFILGQVLYDSNRAPLANAINRDIFSSSFETIFNAFIVAGSFESYIVVFQKIFGDDVVVTFVVPAPGKLQIDVEALTFDTNHLVARRIVSNAYVFDNVVDYNGDNICVQTVKGFQSEYELEQMLFEMVPGGVFTEITLTIG